MFGTITGTVFVAFLAEVDKARLLVSVHPDCVNPGMLRSGPFFLGAVDVNARTPLHVSAAANSSNA